MRDLFRGELVRLTAEDPRTAAKVFSKWSRNSEYLRLLDNEPAYTWSEKMFAKWVEKDVENIPEDECFFFIRTHEEDNLIGFVTLMGINWHQSDAWVGIGIGEDKYWGRGYGTDAMRLVLAYAFLELNLFRVTLGLFSYNARAHRSYEKAGFRLEGNERDFLFRDGTHADGLIMGVLREEWERMER